MSETHNTQVVKDAYAAFARGDIAGILALLDENVEWHAIKGAEGVAPHAGLRRGHAGVAEFFAQLGASTEFQRFEPREFVAAGDTVAVIGEYEATVKTTKRTAASDWVMVFTLRNGRVVRFREWTDSAAIVRAYGAAAAV